MVTIEDAIERLEELTLADAQLHNDSYDIVVLEEAIKALKEVKKHKETFEWCDDCKEYDNDEHCCHRWSKCIRNTLEENQLEIQRLMDNEEKYRWHDLRKNPEDLPEKYDVVWAFIEDGHVGNCGYEHSGFEAIYVDGWESNETSEKAEGVIAWREIEPYNS